MTHLKSKFTGYDTAITPPFFFSSSSRSACLLSLAVLETSASVQSAVAQLQLQDTLGRETPNTRQNYTNMQLAEEVCVFVCVRVLYLLGCDHAAQSGQQQSVLVFAD